MKKAFTLIELLVVIAIIAILSTLSVVALNSARAKARDAKRLADIKNISTALDMYYNEYGVYPAASANTSTTNCLSELGISSTCGTMVYLSEIPADPLNSLDYFYAPIENNSNYTLAFTLESGSGGYEAGDYTAAPGGITTWVCGVDTVADAEGYDYPTVLVGTQCWTQTNLRTAKYNDNTSIPNLISTTTWASATSGAYVWYLNDYNWGLTYGALYNFYAVKTEKLCPVGWHIPSDAEYNILIAYLGGSVVAGGPMKETSTAHWNNQNTGATNASGLTVLPNGGRYAEGVFNYRWTYAILWSSSISSGANAYTQVLGSYYTNVYRMNYSWAFGFAVRCLKD
jgi:uncharacterized protein (TIGR02145 family)/prepilin-type N-terminal cleavage/methylation domain-containing protein